MLTLGTCSRTNAADLMRKTPLKLDENLALVLYKEHPYLHLEVIQKRFLTPDKTASERRSRVKERKGGKKQDFHQNTI